MIDETLTFILPSDDVLTDLFPELYGDNGLVPGYEYWDEVHVTAF